MGHARVPDLFKITHSNTRVYDKKWTQNVAHKHLEEIIADEG
jgi:hypothetical protein